MERLDGLTQNIGKMMKNDWECVCALCHSFQLGAHRHGLWIFGANKGEGFSALLLSLEHYVIWHLLKLTLRQCID
jgi:hypothetical protein